MVKLCLSFCVLLAVLLQASSSPIDQSVYDGNLEGDIRWSEQQKRILAGEVEPEIDAATGTTYIPWRWPMNLNRQVVIPYRFAQGAGFSQPQINLMLSEMRLLEARTCIRFVVRTNQVDFIEIIRGSGCWSWVGRVGGRQELSMGNGCHWEGTPVHEYIHALGFAHMQSAVERDDFVAIQWQNIRPGTESNFDMVDPRWWGNFNTAYDLRSVMHYGRAYFGVNGQDTIIPHDRSYLDIIGQVRMSEGDVTRLNRMYQC